jgi:ankyrin repeat protein
LKVNDIDTYGQNPIYYAVNLGHLDACKVLVGNGSMHDYVDENGETPLYYAIKSNRT